MLALALAPFIAILIYESLYSRLYIDRYHSRITLLAYAVFAIATII